MRVLVTGAAGFIGFHVSKYLLERGDEVVGLDSLNSYYDVKIKYGRLAGLGIDEMKLCEGIMVSSTEYPKFTFVQLQLEDRDGLHGLMRELQFDAVVNLAAQAGVRYSLENPYAYIDSNIVGFINVLEGCRENKVDHLVFASSSSVYGINEKMPFSTSDNVDHPISLYAASKKSNELMAHTYSHLYNLPATGLRFFTVYGPWGRPDMALFLFTDAIIKGRPIKVFNNGKMRRDFTYIDDIVEGIVRTLDRPPKGNPNWSPKNPDPASSPAPFKIYNIGNGQPVDLMDFIAELQRQLSLEAEIEYLPMQPGDVPATWADCSDLERDTGYQPSTQVKTGIARFVQWYRSSHNIDGE
ncbi:MAG: NAD-dependent epimerase [Spirochaetia bacterium]|nr:NAD-dependent epimerase [Spirochaetia bacterium]